MRVEEVPLDVFEVAPEEIDSLVSLQSYEATQDGSLLVVAHGQWNVEAIGIHKALVVVPSISCVVGITAEECFHILVVGRPHVVSLSRLLRFFVLPLPLLVSLQPFLLPPIMLNFFLQSWQIRL